jgi:hypothetical protein
MLDERRERSLDRLGHDAHVVIRHGWAALPPARRDVACRSHESLEGGRWRGFRGGRCIVVVLLMCELVGELAERAVDELSQGAGRLTPSRASAW